jgi:hypothetical protein
MFTFYSPDVTWSHDKEELRLSINLDKKVILDYLVGLNVISRDLIGTGEESEIQTAICVEHNPMLLKEWNQKPRNVGTLQKLRKGRTQILP